MEERRQHARKIHVDNLEGIFTPFTPGGIPLMPFATALVTAAAYDAVSSAWDSGVRVGAQGVHNGSLAAIVNYAGVKGTSSSCKPSGPSKPEAAAGASKSIET